MISRTLQQHIMTGPKMEVIFNAVVPEIKADADGCTAALAAAHYAEMKKGSSVCLISPAQASTGKQ